MQWPYKLYTLLLLGHVPGAERRGTRVFMHMPTTARFLGIPSKRLRTYIECGVDLAIFSGLKKRHAIWSFDVAMPEGFIHE